MSCKYCQIGNPKGDTEPIICEDTVLGGELFVGLFGFIREGTNKLAVVGTVGDANVITNVTELNYCPMCGEKFPKQV